MYVWGLVALTPIGALKRPKRVTFPHALGMHFVCGYIIHNSYSSYLYSTVNSNHYHNDQFFQSEVLVTQTLTPSSDVQPCDDRWSTFMNAYIGFSFVYILFQRSSPKLERFSLDLHSIVRNVDKNHSSTHYCIHCISHTHRDNHCDKEFSSGVVEVMAIG